MATDTNLETAHRAKEKFIFYITALTFTILGLSVQTAKFDLNLASDICEIFSWGFLLSSGLAGLASIESHFAFFYRAGTAELYNEAVKRIGKNAKPESKSEILNKIDNYVEKYKNNEEKLYDIIAKQKSRYIFQRTTFSIGIILLISSRSIEPITGIIWQIMY